MEDRSQDPHEETRVMRERLASIAARLDQMRADLDARAPLFSSPAEKPAAAEPDERRLV